VLQVQKKALGIRKPIKDAETFQAATKNAAGAIIGSAFIKHLTKNGIQGIPDFLKVLR